LTSHYYRDRESSGSFLARRAKASEALETAIAALPEAERAALPARILAAEVAWVPNLAECSHLRELCYQGTDAFLLELPMHAWYDGLFSQIYDLMNVTGLTPVIAHIDRYWNSQKPQRLAELASLGLPTQLSAEALLRFPTRARALKAIQSGQAQFLMSDCHDMTNRRPNLQQGLEIVGKKLGASFRQRCAEETEAILREFAG
jgi:protein-tyrosine phosphatase